MKKIKVELFAGVKEIAGVGTIEVEVASEATAGDVLNALSKAIPGAAGLIGTCRLAVDCRYVSQSDVVQGDADVAVIPPVSGG